MPSTLKNIYLVFQEDLSFGGMLLQETPWDINISWKLSLKIMLPKWKMVISALILQLLRFLKIFWNTVTPLSYLLLILSSLRGWLKLDCMQFSVWNYFHSIEDSHVCEVLFFLDFSLYLLNSTPSRISCIRTKLSIKFDKSLMY